MTKEKLETLLMNHAENKNDALLMKVACGKASIWEYLDNYIKTNDLKGLKINNAFARKIGTSFNANAKRRKQLDKWIAEENKISNPSKVEIAIGNLYKEEAELLDDYAFVILCDFLGIKS